MTTEEKNEFANAAGKVFETEQVQSCLAETHFNLRIPFGGLEELQLSKLVQTTAILARAHALGIDFETELRMTPEEAYLQQLALIEAFGAAGKPVYVIDVDGA